MSLLPVLRPFLRHQSDPWALEPLPGTPGRAESQDFCQGILISLMRGEKELWFEVEQKPG